MSTALSCAKYLFVTIVLAYGYMWAKQDDLLYVPEPGFSFTVFVPGLIYSVN